MTQGKRSPAQSPLAQMKAATDDDDGQRPLKSFAVARKPIPLPELPASTIFRDGQVLYPRESAVWQLRSEGGEGDNLSMDWTKFVSLSPRAIRIAQLLLLSRAGDHSTWTTKADYESLRRFDRWVETPNFEWSSLTFEVAHAWLRHGVRFTSNAGNDFGRLRSLYRCGVGTGIEDFSPQLLEQLKQLQAPGNRKGEAVRSGDPTKGQFTPDEVETITNGLYEGLGDPKDRACVWLCLDIGRNSGVYPLMRKRDLLIFADGERRRFQLRVRRQKKRTTVIETQDWSISAELGELLLSLMRTEDGPDARLLWWLDGIQPRAGFSSCLRRWASSADLRSARTDGERIVLHARRFRVTLLSNAADDGASLEQLVALADHSDSQNVLVYQQRSPHFLERIRSKVDAIYDPYVKRFSGEMMTTAEARRLGLPVVPGFAPQLPKLSLPGLGVCGRTELCELAPPITCYSCRKFIAFADTDHSAVERSMVEYMKGLDERVAIQMAPALAAVREVVREQTRRTHVQPATRNRIKSL